LANPTNPETTMITIHHFKHRARAMFSDLADAFWAAEARLEETEIFEAASSRIDAPGCESAGATKAGPAGFAIPESGRWIGHAS
jgi:hypothetical protein